MLYAYFAAYPAARRARMQARVESAPRARVARLGETVEGRPIDVLIVGDEGPAQRRVWMPLPTSTPPTSNWPRVTRGRVSSDIAAAEASTLGNIDSSVRP